MSDILFPALPPERVATRCVCCGRADLQASPAILMPFVAHRVFGWRPVVIDDSWGLKTIAGGHAYSLCNSLYCAHCDFLFLDIRFSDAELSNLYRDYRGAEYEALREHYEPGYAERNRQLVQGATYYRHVEAFIAPCLPSRPAVLDWGGDTGKNTPFQHDNTLLHVHDISGKPVIAGAVSVSRQETLSCAYDLVVCSQVMEHVPYPADMLLDMRERMHDGTILYLEVPHEPLMRDAVENRAPRKKHWHEHVNFFSPRALGNLLAACGLDIIQMRSFPMPIGDATVDVLQVAARKHLPSA